MGCSNTAGDGKNHDEPTGDRAAIQTGRRHFDADATSWLVGEAIARLHSDDCEGQGGHQRAVELLARLDAGSAVGAVFNAAPREDTALRWSLLYVLAETADPKAADLFARVAMEPIRVERDRRVCESLYDGEVLVRTMAIEGLARLAARDAGIVDLLHKVLEAQPDRALRIETAKAILAAAPKEVERLKKSLPEELHFALTLKHVRAQSLAVEYEASAVDKVRAMPDLDRASTRPTTRNCVCC